MERRDYWIYYVNIDLCHHYGISVTDVPPGEMSLMARGEEGKLISEARKNKQSRMPLFHYYLRASNRIVQVQQLQTILEGGGRVFFRSVYHFLTLTQYLSTVASFSKISSKHFLAKSHEYPV